MSSVTRDSTHTLSRRYDTWSKFYDQTFKILFTDRQRRAINEMHLGSGDRVLDLGVGTGITLPLYPAGVRVVGVDLSPGMLREARRKNAAALPADTHLVRADALTPPFPDASFDHVLMSHVISVVSDPVRLLNVVARITRSGGRIVLISHFRSRRTPLAAVEKLLNPICLKLGWSSDINLPEILDRSDLQLAYQFKINPLDIWQIAVLMHRHPYPIARNT